MPTIVAAVLAGALLADATPLSAPDLRGRWVLVRQRSDDVREQIVACLGQDYARSDGRPDAPQAWIRGWLLDQAEKPEPRVLTIEQSAVEFRTEVDDDVRVYYFGRETSREELNGPRRRASVRVDGARIVVEERAEKGSGHVVERYELQDEGRRLLLIWRLEHKRLGPPLELRLTFQKAPPAPGAAARP